MSDPRERAIARHMEETGASREGAEDYVAHVENLFGPIEEDEEDTEVGGDDAEAAE